MKRTMMYSVGGQTLTVDPDNDQQFNESAMSSGYEAKPVRRFRVSGRTIDLADDEVNDFFTAAKSAGYTPEELRTYKMADGSAREMSGSEMSRYLRSPEYRESEDYEESRKKLNDELGSPMWAAIKGAISGGIEGALEGGKAGVAKAAWALPQVGTGVMRAVGNLANGLGNGRNALGDALVRGANAADAKMEEIMPTSTAERLGYEDWGTKTGDFFGNVAGMAVKFAPAGGTSLAAKVFTEAMLASDGVNAYEGTLRTAQENGADVATANALGMVSGLVNYFGGKALLKAGGVSKDIKNPLLRELAAAATSGGVMGVQGGANKAIENAATNKDVGEGVLGAVGEGLAEGALFHGANMIPRAPSLVRQTKAHFNAAKDWITEAAANDPAMLSDLMDQPALDEVIAARRKGESVSRKMGDDIFLPNNMSGEQRNAVVDSIIAYRDGAAEAAKNAEATKAKEKQAAADKRGEQAVRTFREGEERARAEFNAEARKNGDDAPDAELERQPVTRNEGRGENADILQQSADQYARDDADGAKAYGSWLKKQGKKDTAANRMDWFVNDYAKRGDHPLTHRATENEIPDISREEYDKAISDWTAKKESAQKQGKKFDEPKPYAEYEDYDALLAEQKSRMDAADRAAAEAAHEERGKGLAEAFADWREESVKAQKQGKKSPEPTAEVEDVRAKAEADAVVQRLNTEWQKAKTPAERNAIKAQLIDRLKQMGIGATERGTSAAEKAAEPAKPQTADNTPSRAPTETQPTSRPEGADGKEARSGASRVDDFVSSMKPMVAAKAKKSLGSKRDYGTGNNHDVMTDAEFVEKQVGKGAVMTAQVFSTSGKPKVDYILGDSVITKTQADYAKHLGAKIDNNSIERAKEEIALKSAVDKVTDATNGSYSPYEASDENIAKHIAEFEKRDEKALRKLLDIRPDMKAEYDALKSIRDARIKRGDWSVEEKTPSVRVPDGKGKMVEKPAATAEKSSVVAPTAQAEVTAESLRERAKTDPEMRRLDEAQKKAKTDAERNALLAKAQERIGELRKEMEADAKVEKPKAVEKPKKNKPLTDLSDSAPLTRNVEGIKAEEKAAKAKFKAEKAEILSEVEKAITKNDGVLSQKSIDGNNLYDAWIAEKNRIAKLEEPKYDRFTHSYKPSLKTQNELAAAKARLMEIEKDAGHGKDTPTVEINVGGAKYSVKNDPLSLRQFRENVQKRFGKEASKRYYEIIEADRLAALRSDAKVKSWAQKNGYSVVEGEVSPRAVAEYLRSQTKKAVAATKRLFKDAEVEVKDRDWNAEIDGENGALRDNEGRVVGTFDLATKKVTLYRGADERTVYHELIGHGVEDWARRNNTALHDKLTELARTAPRELVEDVRSRYPDADEATLTKEIIARVAEGKGLENIKLKDAPKTWYAKAYVAVKDALVGFMEKIGLNRIDLSKTDDMTPSEAMDYLMREIGKGRTLGEIGTAEVQGKMTRAEKWANKYYDRHTSLGKVSKEAADAKALQPGREAEFEIMKFNPKKEEFKKLLKDGNVTGNEVDEYMRAVAAKERNAADGRESSGMSGERIDATLRFYENHPRIDAIKEAADFMWKLQDEGMRERIRSGLVSEAEYDEWKAREEHHVPFRSAVDENGDHIAWNDPRGVAGHEFVQHEGRYSESGSPTAWMFEEYANAHLRAIENDTRKVLADAVSRDASLGAVTTNPNLRESRLNGDGGDRNVVSYKAIGENGRAVVKHIVLKGERGAAAASSYTNRDLMNKSPLLKKTQAFMRFWSSTATEWSPTFALRNTFADNVDLAAVVLAEKGAKEGGAWIKDYAKNRVAVAKEVWRFARKGEVDADSTLGRYVKEGGMIGGFQREGYGDLVKQFSAEDIAKDFSNGGNRAKAVAKKVFGLVGAVNTYAELMTRVSAFKTNLDNGMSAKDAALWSRRVSVDFNRKGNVTPITNTLFMFSNSTIGATMRQLEAVNTAWKTPQGKRALLGLAAFGVAEALLEHAMNADSDEEREKKGEATGKDVNEFTRKTSLYVRVGGHVFRAPAHEDPLMKIVYAANSATRVMLGTMSKEDFAKEVGLGIAEDVPRFFGQGSKNMDAGFNTWVPTALQPLIQGIENKDYAGRPIYRPKYNESLPDSSNGRKSTQTQYKWAAETVNELTGGNKGRKGSVDIAPETVKLISESLGKNVGKDIGNAIDVGWNLLTGNFGDLDSRRAPIVRDVVRKTEGNDNRYFEAVRRFNADKLDLQTRDKARNWGEGERRAYYEAHPHLRKNGGASTRVERLINGHTDGDTHVPGINDLRRMEGGERRVKTAAGWKWRAYDWSAEKVEEFKRKRLEKQAKVLAIMGD